jgi:hypothetical protein
MASARWAEALVFAAAEGAADSVLAEYIRLGFEGSPGGARLITALEIVSLADVPADPDLCRRVIDAAGRTMASDDVFAACRVGLKTLSAGRRALPPTLALVPSLLNAGLPWSRLCAWSLTAVLDPEQYDIDAALVALTDVLSEVETRNRLARGIVIDDPERELLRVLGEAVIVRLLESRSILEVDPIVEALIRRPGLDNMGFWQRVTGHLTGRGSTVNPFKNFKWKGPDLDVAGFDAATAHAYRSICEALMAGPAINQDNLPPSRRHHIGAVYRIGGWGKMSLGDVWVWKRTIDPRTTRAAFQGLIVAGGLDPEAVELDARHTIRALEDRTGEAFTAIFTDMPKVDLPETDWTALDRSTLDVEGLKTAVLDHPSELVVPLAADLLDAILTETERLDICRQALARSARLQVWAGAALATSLPKEQATEVLSANLTPGSRGLADRLAALEKVVGHCDPSLLSRLTPILTGGDPTEVCAAAKFAATANLTEADLEMIRKAERHWRDWEEEQADKPHTPSPRPELLKILEDHDAVSLEDLIEGAALAWGSSTAKGALHRRLQASDELRRAFADRCGNATIDPGILDSVFRSEVRFAAKDLDLLEPVFSSPDGRIRLSAVALLDQAAYTLEQRKDRLISLRGDVEPLVRSRAARALERLELLPDSAVTSA